MLRQTKERERDGGFLEEKAVKRTEKCEKPIVITKLTYMIQSEKYMRRCI